MKKKAIVLSLFLLQCYCVTGGRTVFGMDGNPVVLLLSSLFIAILFISLLRKGKLETGSYKSDPGKKAIGFAAGVAAIGICIPAFSNLLSAYPNPGEISDVLPQIDALYTRYASGKFPYYPLEEFDWKPYPVYMPLNWLPLAISYYLKTDIRWTGIIAMAIANGIWGIFLWQRDATLVTKLISLLMPAIIILSFIGFSGMDIAVSLETLIAAYYIILAIGIANNNLLLITIGLILCLLSRYTMVFWLPLFGIIGFQQMALKKNIIMWLSVLAAILVIYIIPFYLKDPSILQQGIAYHNKCAVSEWTGHGNPPIAYIFSAGIYLGSYFKTILPGDNATQVFIMRSIQGLLMAVLNVWGIWYYRKHNGMYYPYYLVVMLYLFVLLFYLFSPMLFKYYHIVTLSLSAVLCSIMITQYQPEPSIK
ncbi:MAG: hypothetical protein JNK00_06665 [Flavipsychrobacter sp.]|nr:hypothetical protein [Flavipsychrobacter sp.]